MPSLGGAQGRCRPWTLQGKGLAVRALGTRHPGPSAYGERARQCHQRYHPGSWGCPRETLGTRTCYSLGTWSGLLPTGRPAACQAHGQQWARSARGGQALCTVAVPEPQTEYVLGTPAPVCQHECDQHWASKRPGLRVLLTGASCFDKKSCPWGLYRPRRMNGRQNTLGNWVEKPVSPWQDRQRPADPPHAAATSAGKSAGAAWPPSRAGRPPGRVVNGPFVLFSAAALLPVRTAPPGTLCTLHMTADNGQSHRNLQPHLETTEARKR